MKAAFITVRDNPSAEFVSLYGAAVVSGNVLIPHETELCPFVPKVPFAVLSRWHEKGSLACGIIYSREVETLTKLPWDGEGDPPEEWLEAPDSKSVTTTVSPSEGEPVGKLSSGGSAWSDGTWDGDGPDEGCAASFSTVVVYDPPMPDWSAGTADYESEITEFEEDRLDEAPGLGGITFRGEFGEEYLEASLIETVTTIDDEEFTYYRYRRAMEFKFVIDLRDHNPDEWPPGAILSGAIRWRYIDTTDLEPVPIGDWVVVNFALTEHARYFESDVFSLSPDPVGEEEGRTSKTIEVSQIWIPNLPW